MIVMGRHIRVDGKVRTDTKFPCGYQDVITINRTGEHFRLIYDVKGRFYLHRISVTNATVIHPCISISIPFLLQKCFCV